MDFGGLKCTGSLPIYDGSWRGNDAAQAQAQHIEASGQGHLGHADIIRVCYFVESSGQHGRHSSTDHAVESERNESCVAAELFPIQGIIR